jgi:hypothetical protein
MVRGLAVLGESGSGITVHVVDYGVAKKKIAARAARCSDTRSSGALILVRISLRGTPTGVCTFSRLAVSQASSSARTILWRPTAWFWSARPLRPRKASKAKGNRTALDFDEFSWVFNTGNADDLKTIASDLGNYSDLGAASLTDVERRTKRL